LIHRLISHFDIYTVLFGAISVAAFWYAIQLCWSVVGKPWYSKMWRLLAALGLLGVGFCDDFLYGFWGLNRRAAETTPNANTEILSFAQNDGRGRFVRSDETGRSRIRRVGG
jgi:hypothetical protein